METENQIPLLDLQAEVDERVETSSKSELTQCARLLATYVALYKHEYGELTTDRFSELSARLSDNDEFSEAVYSSGLRELLETLAVVDREAGNLMDPDVGSRTIN